MKPHNLFCYILCCCSLFLGCNSKKAPTEESISTVAPKKTPLSSWHESKSKQAILDFVSVVTDSNHQDFVPIEDRIAVFDNDGTLWVEKPYYTQLKFALDRIKATSKEHPEWKKDPIVQAVLKDDLQAILKEGEKGLMKVVMYSHAGMTTEEFDQQVSSWLDTARHPKTQKKYTEMVYQPMIELIHYLQENQFKVYICSGGGIDFIRPWAYKVYNISKENVIGSSLKMAYEITPEGLVISRLPEINSINDKEIKPVNIQLHIGQKPIAAFGNSDGDLAMLSWTASGKNHSLMAFVHHTDSIREWQYDRDSHVGTFTKGLDSARSKGWTLIDMQRDWKVIYPYQKK
ncbi:HAD family hydrolase [Algivirga pacifica]|uniref:HAD family hydrolase n=1 Tax=Algivirga pacifica TaxID=1162670 RepID=A0ABP9DIN0_9BACT